MTFLYHKVLDDGSVSFTFKVEPPLDSKLPHRGKIVRSDQPDDPFYDLILVEGYDIELKVEARNGLTEISMERKQSRKEELPATSRSGHFS